MTDGEAGGTAEITLRRRAKAAVAPPLRAAATAAATMGLTRRHGRRFSLAATAAADTPTHRTSFRPPVNLCAASDHQAQSESMQGSPS